MAWRDPEAIKARRLQDIRGRLAATTRATIAKKDGAPKLALAGAVGVLLGGGAFLAITAFEAPPEAKPYFETCRHARQAQLAPALRGRPGYWPHLDADNDGIACEPFVENGLARRN